MLTDATSPSASPSRSLGREGGRLLLSQLALAVTLVACGGDPATSDAETFCQDKEMIECSRRNHRGELNTMELQACVSAVPSRCVAFAWPSSCAEPPTWLETDACLQALRLEANVAVPFADIPECRALCP
jgi:hypothetical protein